MKQKAAKKLKPEKIPDKEAVWRTLGLAIRARKAVTGAEMAELALKRQKACLILIAADAAENTCRKILGQCRQSDIPAMLFGSKAEIGHWTGHPERAIVTILDPGFAGRIQQIISATGSYAEAAGQSAEKDHLEEKVKTLW